MLALPPPGEPINVTTLVETLLRCETEAELRAVMGAAAAGGATLTVCSVTNSQRLAGTRGDDTTPLVAGDIVKVTNQGDRIEMYLGGADFTNPNWLVLEDTAEIVFDPAGLGLDLIINGVAIDASDPPTNCGWVKVRDGVPVGDVDGTFTPSTAGGGIAFDTIGSRYYNANYDAYRAGQLLLLTDVIGHTNPITRLVFPVSLPPRSTVSLKFG